jgi:pyruvyltransferase
MTTEIPQKKVELINGCVPLNWWVRAPNFGDALSPWLIRKMTNRKVVFNKGRTNTFLAIGSVISKATNNTVVWGSGAFGTETSSKLAKGAEYRAVRGPLTRNLLRMNKIDCPEVYGDPALLVPKYHHPLIEKEHEVGVVLRWSESQWNELNFGPGIKKIFLGSDNVEETLDEILSCKRILSSSLHGVIIADAYNIPSAWIASETPKGLAFKYYDYFLSVNKVQKPQEFAPRTSDVSLVDLLSHFTFDERKIDDCTEQLLKACPLPLSAE